jgi:hypothetical protein
MCKVTAASIIKKRKKFAEWSNNEEFLLSLSLTSICKEEKWVINFFPNEIPLTQHKPQSLCIFCRQRFFPSHSPRSLSSSSTLLIHSPCTYQNKASHMYVNVMSKWDHECEIFFKRRIALFFYSKTLS